MAPNTFKLFKREAESEPDQAGSKNYTTKIFGHHTPHANKSTAEATTEGKGKLFVIFSLAHNIICFKHLICVKYRKLCKYVVLEMCFSRANF